MDKDSLLPADHQPASDSLPDLRPTPADAPADPDSPRLSSPNSGWADTSQDALLAQKLQDDETAAAAAPPLGACPPNTLTANAAHWVSGSWGTCARSSSSSSRGTGPLSRR